MKQYMTTQRKKLISFLQEHPDRQFTAKEIFDILSEGSVSLSAVYRNLSVLEENGQITGVYREGCRDKYYRCQLSDKCKGSIHLTCTKCGKTLHMNKDSANTLIAAAASKDEFRITASKTVIYGVCKDCN